LGGEKVRQRGLIARASGARSANELNFDRDRQILRRPSQTRLQIAPQERERHDGPHERAR
jgi:hypothetical protein